MRLLPLLVCVSLISFACSSARSPLPDSVARKLKTPDGSEVNVVCPPSLTDVDPDKLATADAERFFLTPGAVSTLLPPEAPNSLSTLIPLQASTGPIDCCGGERNEDFGARFGGGFASEEQLVQIGRLCGVTASGGMSMRVDLYATSPGAAEAYKREAATMMDSPTGEGVEQQDDELLASIGDSRLLRRIPTIVNDQRIDNDDYELLFKRRNIVARMRLSYGFYWNPGKGEPTPLLEYASQLDRNIEAAAQ